MMKKKKCKGCKNKPMGDLNKIEEMEEKMPLLVKVLIFVYTLLAGYGAVRIVMDLNSLIDKFVG